MALVLSSFGGFGQSHFIGIRGGPSTIWNKFDAASDKANSIGYEIALTYQYKTQNSFFFGIDLATSRKGFSRRHTLETPTINEDFFTDTYFYYLAIPVKAGLAIGNKNQLVSSVGISPAFEMQAIVRYREDIADFSPESYEFDDYTQGFDLYSFVELGGNFILGKNIVLAPLLIFQYSLTSWTIPESWNNYEGHHFSLVYSLGAKYQIGK